MKRILFFLTLLCLTLSSDAEEVVIEGKAPAYRGEKVELVAHKDHLTKMDTVLARGKVGVRDSAFRLELERSRITPAWLRIGNAKAKIYLEPGREYRVGFPEVPDDRIQRIHGHTEVEMTFYELPKHDANNLVIDLNQVHEHFFIKNYHAMSLRYGSGGGYSKHRTDIGKKRDSTTKAKIRQAPSMEQLVDSLEKKLEERYTEVDKEWFRVHYRHALAPIRETATKDRKGIYQRYFRDEPVRPEHEEYMHHFLGFYDRYLVDFARRYDSILDLESVLRYRKDPAPILEGLKSQEADYMGRKAIRELVVVDGMIDAFYHQKAFDKEGIHAILDSMAKNASKEGIRRMARNTGEFLSRRQRGSKAPSFRLMDEDTNIVSLEDLRGSPIYINFWATWNETSLKDMRLIKKLHELYGKNVRFVSICTDDRLRDMKRFLEEHPEYDWTFLYLGSHDEVEEAYQVASIPAYYFLNARGRYIMVPGPKPGEDARKRIHAVNERIERKKARGRRGRGWDH